MAHPLLLHEKQPGTRRFPSWSKSVTPDGKVTVPSGMSFFHTAFELQGNRLEDTLAFAAQAKQAGFIPNYGPVRHNSELPLGDNNRRQCRLLFSMIPTTSNVEFCAAMDTIEKYCVRYANAKGSSRA